MEAVKSLGLAPIYGGNGNRFTAPLQCTIGKDENARRSVASQRIQNSWLDFRRGYKGWLINFIERKSNNGRFDLGSKIHLECGCFCCCRCCCLSLFQLELDD